MPLAQGINLLIDKIRESQTAEQMTDNCFQLIIKYGNSIDIIPAQGRDFAGYTAFEPGERHHNIFNITQSWSSSIGEDKWKYKNISLSTHDQSGACMISQLDAIDEKMGNIRGIHTANPGCCFYDTFNKMDTLFHLCESTTTGPNFDKHNKTAPTETSFDNLIIEIKYPDCTPTYRADVCNRLINSYDQFLVFTPIDNPNKAVKYAVRAQSNQDNEKQRIFAVCETIDGSFAIIYSKRNFQIANKANNPEAIHAFQALFELCKTKVR